MRKAAVWQVLQPHRSFSMKEAIYCTTEHANQKLHQGQSRFLSAKRPGICFMEYFLDYVVTHCHSTCTYVLGQSSQRWWKTPVPPGTSGGSQPNNIPSVTLHYSLPGYYAIYYSVLQLGWAQVPERITVPADHSSVTLFRRMTGLLFTLLLLSADVQLNPGPVTTGALQNFGADLCLCRWTWENKFDKETRYCCIRHNRPGFWTSRNKCVKYKKSSAPWKVPKLEMLLILTPSLLSQSWIF